MTYDDVISKFNKLFPTITYTHIDNGNGTHIIEIDSVEFFTNSPEFENYLTELVDELTFEEAMSIDFTISDKEKNNETE